MFAVDLTIGQAVDPLTTLAAKKPRGEAKMQSKQRAKKLRPKGFFCRKCQAHRLFVRKSVKPAPDLIIRYRRCTVCEHKIVTKEIIDEIRTMRANQAIAV